MDWYSRCITGIRVTPVSTKSVDIAATLFQAYRPRPAGADWPAHAAWPDHGIPRGIVLDRDAIEGPMADGARQGGAASPALVPETLVVDHGKEDELDDTAAPDGGEDDFYADALGDA